MTKALNTEILSVGTELLLGHVTNTDARDVSEQGTPYHGSGCLIHGLSVVADSFIAIDHLMKERPEDAENLIKACACNFEGYEELRGIFPTAWEQTVGQTEWEKNVLAKRKAEPGRQGVGSGKEGVRSER